MVLQKKANTAILQVIKKFQPNPYYIFFIEQISYQINKKASKTKRKEFD